MTGFSEHDADAKRGNGDASAHTSVATPPDHLASVERRLRALVGLTPDAMLIIGSDDAILVVNDQVARLFGHRPEDLVGRPARLLFAEHVGGALSAGAAIDAARSQPVVLELAGRRRDGGVFPVDVSLAPVDGDEGMVAAVIRDMTARRAADAALQASERRFRAFLELAPDAVVIVGGGGRIVLVNAQLERLFGYRREELLGRPVEVLLPERLRGAHERHRRGYGDEPEVRAMGAGLDLLGRRRDGTEFPVDISLSPLETEEGSLVAAAIRDVTERRRAERELKAAYRELESFSYSVSHDLRAPLRSIDGFSSIILEEHADGLGDEGRRLFERVRAASQRMGELIDDLLLLSRVSRTEMTLRPVDLGALARQVAARLADDHPSRHVEMEIDVEDVVPGDPGLLRVALENLLGNAWKFTRGRDPAHVTFTATGPPGAREYHIRDNGAGFDMAYADKLFGPFQRLHGPRDFEGNGIGLATVQRIVRRHGGRVSARGAVGEGAEFSFTLRAVEAPMSSNARS